MGDLITVHVRIGGGAAAAGVRSVRLAAGATAADLVSAVAPDLGVEPGRLAGVAVAIDGEIAARDRPLRDGERAALVLPVAGG